MGGASLEERTIRAILRMLSDGEPARVIARKTGVAYSTINTYKKRYKDGEYSEEYVHGSPLVDGLSPEERGAKLKNKGLKAINNLMLTTVDDKIRTECALKIIALNNSSEFDKETFEEVTITAQRVIGEIFEDADASEKIKLKATGVVLGMKGPAEEQQEEVDDARELALLLMIAQKHSPRVKSQGEYVF